MQHFRNTYEQKRTSKFTTTVLVEKGGGKRVSEGTNKTRGGLVFDPLWS